MTDTSRYLEWVGSGCVSQLGIVRWSLVRMMTASTTPLRMAAVSENRFSLAEADLKKDRVDARFESAVSNARRVLSAGPSKIVAMRHRLPCAG